MASRAVQGVLRKGYPLARNSIKQKCLTKKFELPFIFEEAGPSNAYNSITTQTTTASRQISQTNTPSELVNKSAYATVAPGLENSTGPASASKFRVPFDEGPSMSNIDDIVQQVESIPVDVQKERGYQIIGKVKATDDGLKNILALGDMRVWL